MDISLTVLIRQVFQGTLVNQTCFRVPLSIRHVSGYPCQSDMSQQKRWIKKMFAVPFSQKIMFLF